MSNKRFEMFEFRAALIRMRHGDSDRAIARSGLMGRNKARQFRVSAKLHGWLDPGSPLPDEEEMAWVAPNWGKILGDAGASSVEPYRAQVEEWAEERDPGHRDPPRPDSDLRFRRGLLLGQPVRPQPGPVQTRGDRSSGLLARGDS